ncbi:helix-turn-helix domain-containing protein [Gracilimonas sp.]|uniref:helix-turn-helix domain-containing protein n=1 Tax=Gracilimonas sp. TaxID=1974203 RepID=UPI003753403F
MVSLRCKKLLRDALKKTDLNYSISPHGAVVFLEETTDAQLKELNENLLKSGLELLDKNDSMLIDRIINTVIDVIHDSDELPNVNFDDFIDSDLGTGRESILKIFSDVKGMSIMQFIVLEKIERVKEFLLYDDLSMAEIAEKLRYKNEDLLIAQFKKYTGLSPDYFKEMKKERMSVLQTV